MRSEYAARALSAGSAGSVVPAAVVARYPPELLHGCYRENAK